MDHLIKVNVAPTVRNLFNGHINRLITATARHATNGSHARPTWMRQRYITGELINSFIY